MPSSEGHEASPVQQKCEHTFIKKYLSKPVPTFCAYCQKIIWVFQGQIHNCTKCDVFYHEGCFQQILRNKEALLADVGATVEAGSENTAAGAGARSLSLSGSTASPSGSTVISAGQTHKHRLSWRTYYTPTLCTVCRKLLTGFRKQGLECSECDFHCHEKCIPTDASTVQEEDNSSKSVVGGIREAHASGSAGEVKVKQDDKLGVKEQDAAMSNTLHMLEVFNQRNKRWVSTALNPISMLGLYRRHADLYQQACEAMKEAELPVEELLDIRAVLKYATAAYGQAYDEGHFASCFGAVVMRIARREVLVPKAETNTQAVCDILALPRSAIHYAKWSGEIFEANYFIMCDAAAKSIIFCFRGSLSDADFLTDASGELTEFCGGHAHQGMVQIVDKVFADEEAMRTVKALLEAHPDFRFIVTGHSLGAGLTALFTVKAIHEKIFSVVPKGYCFAPPPVVTAPLANDFDGHITSVVAAKDVVCRLQFNSVDRLGLEISQYEKKEGDGWSTPSESQCGELTEEVHIPGTIYMFTKPSNRTTRMVAVPRTNLLLHQIFLSKYMVTNHHMHNYDHGLKAVLSKVTSSTDAAASDAAPVGVYSVGHVGDDDEEGNVLGGDDEEQDASAIWIDVAAPL